MIGRAVRRIVSSSRRLRDAMTLRRLAARRGFTVEARLRPGVYRVGRDGSPFVLKRTTEIGLLAVRDVLPPVRDRLERVVIPVHACSGRHPALGPWTIARWIEGDDFERRWSETAPATIGGREIPEARVHTFLDVVEDLTSVSLPPSVPRPVVVTPNRHARAIRRGLEAAAAGRWLPPAEIERLRALVAPLDAALSGPGRQLTNGDLQLRNLIESGDGRVGVIDWDACRVSPLEREHACSYQWLLMWNNPAWQRRLIREARRRLPLDPGLFRAALALNALVLARTFGPWPRAREAQLRSLEQAMDDAGFDRVWTA